jgi:hypothetical protein
VKREKDEESSSRKNTKKMVDRKYLTGYIEKEERDCIPKFF